jgi:hypothetical protein
MNMGQQSEDAKAVEILKMRETPEETEAVAILEQMRLFSRNRKKMVFALVMSGLMLIVVGIYGVYKASERAISVTHSGTSTNDLSTVLPFLFGFLSILMAVVGWRVGRIEFVMATLLLRLVDKDRQQTDDARRKAIEDLKAGRK